MNQRAGRRLNRRDAHGLNVIQPGANGIEGRIVGHPHAKASRAGATDRPLKAICAKGILQVKPAAGRNGPLTVPVRRHAYQSAAMTA